MTKEELQVILEKHKKWLNGEMDGERADLREADLRRADFQGADLREANLQEANLRGADLWEAKNIDRAKNFPYPDLYILKSVEGKIKAYKLVDEKNEGIFNGGLKYKIGKVVEVEDFDDDERILCGEGINVATLSWCQNQKQDDTQKILEVEFEAKDIVAIPFATDGKFRVKKCKVLREVKE